MKLKMPFAKGDRADDNDDMPKSARRGMFSRKKKAAQPQASGVSGLSDFSVDTDALARLHGVESAPSSTSAAPLRKAPSDAVSSSDQLVQVALRDPEAAADSQQAQAAVEEAVQVISERAEELAEAAQAAKAYRPACLALAGFAASVCQVLQARAPVVADPAALSEVAALLGAGAALAAPCSAPDWLLLAAAPERGLSDALARLHGEALAALKGQGLDAVPGGPRLPPADQCRDGSKALQRRLRQLGGGSASVGLAAVAEDEEAQQELADALGVEAEDVRSSAAHILAAGLAAPEAGAGAATDAQVAAHLPALRRVFAGYVALGARGAPGSATLEMDSFRAAKLAREAGLLGGPLRAQDADVLFATAARQGGGRRLDFDGFLRFLSLAADKRGEAVGQVAARLATLEGPTLSGTTPEAVKWHDDRSTYTGVYARGMSVADARLDLGSLVDRDAADKAARRASLPSARRASGAATPAATPPLSRTFSGAGGQGGKSTPASSAASPRIRAHAGQGEEAEAAECDPLLERALRDSWTQFAVFGRNTAAAGDPTMDGQQFMKLCRDCGLLSKQLSGTRVDLIFLSTAPKGARRITFGQFKAALPRLAEARGCEEGEVAAAVAGCQGPSKASAITPDAVRLSDRSNFTGIAARGGPSTVDKGRITLAAMCDRSGRRGSLGRAE